MFVCFSVCMVCSVIGLVPLRVVMCRDTLSCSGDALSVGCLLRPATPARLHVGAVTFLFARGHLGCQTCDLKDKKCFVLFALGHRKKQRQTTKYKLYAILYVP